MLYKRSSFLRWLSDVKDCDIIPKPDSNVIIVKNGMVKTYMITNKFDRIDYEEIWLVCSKLYIDGLPGDSELEKAE